jgi:hypothetical protein
MIAAEVAQHEDTAGERRAALLQEIEVIEAGLATCDREAQRWAEAYAAEVISLPELKEYRTEIATRRHRLQVQHAGLRVEMEAIGQTSGHLESLISYCIHVRQCLQTFDEREKRLALEALDIRVTWTPHEPLTIQGSIPLSDIVPVPSGQVTPQLMSRAAEPEKPVYGSQPVRAQSHPLLYPYCPASICGKEPHYFQEVAIRRVIERIVAGQKRILLTHGDGARQDIHGLSDCVEAEKIRLAPQTRAVHRRPQGSTRSGLQYLRAICE